MDAFEEFETKSFVSRLLGKGDVKGLAKKLEEIMPEEKQMEFLEQMQKGSMTLRTYRGFLEQVGSMGPLSSVRLFVLTFLHEKIVGMCRACHEPTCHSGFPLWACRRNRTLAVCSFVLSGICRSWGCYRCLAT
jgi:hypothetical protein